MPFLTQRLIEVCKNSFRRISWIRIIHLWMKSSFRSEKIYRKLNIIQNDNVLFYEFFVLLKFCQSKYCVFATAKSGHKHCGLQWESGFIRSEKMSIYWLGKRHRCFEWWRAGKLVLSVLAQLSFCCPPIQPQEVSVMQAVRRQMWKLVSCYCQQCSA